jgi:photosystem II stability/assembly factor-like uncharacterized protein
MQAIPGNNRKFLWGMGAYGGISAVAQASSPVPGLRAHTGMGTGGDAGATIIPVQTYALRFTHPLGTFGSRHSFSLHTTMLPKRLLALTLFAALAVMPPCVLRAQWVQTNGPNGGDISALMVDSSGVVAVNWNEGVFQSTDLGLNWEPAGQGLPNSAIWSLYRFGKYLFAGTDENGIYRTSYGNWLWSPCDSGIQGTEIVSITSISQFMIAAGYGGAGIYRSSDSGSSWLQSGIGLGDTFVHSVTTLGSIVYAGTDQGCYASTDSGRTWQTAGSELQDSSIEVIAPCNGILFAGLWGGGIFRSSDQGKHWILSSNGLSGSGLYIGAIAAIGNLLVANTDGGIYRSIDNGISWNLVMPSLAVVGDPTLAAFGSVLFAGSGFNYGIFRSTDSGQSWASVGLPNTYVEALAANGNEILEGDEYNTLNISMDGGANWNNSKNGINQDFVMAFDVNEGVLFAGSYDGVYRSTDAGTTWLPPNPSLEYTYVVGITHVGSTLIAATEERGILRSTDNGETWNLSNSGLTDTTIYAVVQTRGIFFAGTNHTVFRSIDSGQTWSNVPGLPDYSEEALLADDSLLLAGDYRSTDLGNSWILKYNSPADPFIQCFTADDELIFAGTMTYYHYIDTTFVAQPSGVFVSSDRGANWIEADTGLPISSVKGLAVSGGFLYAGTEGTGVWRRPLSDFGISSVAQTPEPTPSEIQIYPNPFTQSTQITFTSQAAGYAEVSIVNMLGMEVARLFSGELGAGEHNFSWSNPTGLPDGTYECLVRMNGQVDDRSSTVQALPVVLMR